MTPGRGQKYTDDQLLEMLRAWVRVHGEPATVTGISSPDKSDPWLPTPATYMKRFGSWNEACKRAGVKPGSYSRRDYTRRWTYDDQIDAVADYLGEDGSEPTARGYEDWARQQENRPSLAVIRMQGHRWSEVRTAALERLRTRTKR
jgi:hypothetical protein